MRKKEKENPDCNHHHEYCDHYYCHFLVKIMNNYDILILLLLQLIDNWDPLGFRGTAFFNAIVTFQPLPHFEFGKMVQVARGQGCVGEHN